MATKKIMPLDKTVLTEFKIQVADIHLRTKYLNGSAAVRVPRDTSFISADATVTSETPIVITGIKSVVAIYAFEPFEIDMTQTGGAITGIKCNGLFILYGALESVTIKATPGGAGTRLTYLYA